MKTLKLNHAFARDVVLGRVRSTWRMNDEKGISVNDDIELIDQVDPVRPDSWKAIGVAHVDRVVQKRLADVVDADFGLGGSRDEMIDTYRGYYGEDVTDDAPVKILDFSFEAYVVAKQVELEPSRPLKVIKLYADGGSRGNPGPSAAGYVLLTMQGDVIKKSGVYLGITTNNQAEYQALKFALEEARRLPVTEVEVYMDSLLVVNQMKGIFKVKNRDLWPIHDEIVGMLKYFHKVNFTHVPRELNKLADAEVNDTLDAELKD